MYASPAYQERMGGAYILCPLANESLSADGQLQNSWMTPAGPGDPGIYRQEVFQEVLKACPDPEWIQGLLGADSVYSGTLYRLLHETLDQYRAIKNVVLFGTSAGGYGAWRLLINHPEDFRFAVLMSGAYLPATSELQKIEDSGCEVLICHSRTDEAVPFEWTTGPNMPFFERSRHFQTYCPVLVRRGDRGVASVVDDGFQMGQHCINEEVQQDLMYLDGSPYDRGIPDGITGLIRKYTAE